MEITGPGSQVVVAELLPEIVRWNHEHLDGLNDEILADPRTQVVQSDVFELINKASQKGGKKFDAILLDVDDGPTSLIQPQNIQLYGRDGLDMIKSALTPGGRLAIWAAVDEPKLLKALGHAGFRTEEIPCAKHERAKRLNHRVYLAERRD